ncbi:uncharacterized protein [Diabrotica undecimpunctata]|uniref:uncharacterized protein isoform X2 n=1 Tax=Diabrotica undecimpunctata TaxID=50387 RepID=UPI003B63BF0C
MLFNYLCSVVMFIVFFLVSCKMAKPVDSTIEVTASNETSKRYQRSGGAIIFPDDDFNPGVLPRLKGTPPCAKGSTFCEHFGEYPHDLLKNILKEHSVNKDLFGTDIVPQFEARDGSNDLFVCQSKVMTVFPKVAKNVNNDWRIIINQGEKEGYIQGVVIETCMGKDRQCDILGDIMDDFVTTCKQKYIYRRLLSLNDAGKPVQDTFRLPSACCCSYRKNFDFLAGLDT